MLVPTLLKILVHLYVVALLSQTPSMPFGEHAMLGAPTTWENSIRLARARVRVVAHPVDNIWPMYHSS